MKTKLIENIIASIIFSSLLITASGHVSFAEEAVFYSIAPPDLAILNTTTANISVQVKEQFSRKNYAIESGGNVTHHCQSAGNASVVINNPTKVITREVKCGKRYKIVWAESVFDVVDYQ